jgi:hypothetical protein
MGDDVKIVDGYEPTRKANVSEGNFHVGVYNTAGNNWNINDTGQGHVVMRGDIDTNNSPDSVSTASALLATAGVYTGSPTDILDYAIINVSVFSDVESATDGLCIQQARHIDATSTAWGWHEDTYTIPAGRGKTFSAQAMLPYFRVKYTNGASTQSTFQLNTLLKKSNTKPSSHRIQDSIVDDDDAELTKAVLTAKTSSGTFVNIQSTDSENLRVTDAENGLAIAKGDVVGHSNIHKFGETGAMAKDIRTDVWNYSATEEIYTFSTTADIDTISSSINGDTQDILITGLDTNWAVVSQTITLTGQTKSLLSTPLIRVYRMQNVGSTDLTGIVYIYPDTAITNGVPNDTTTIRGIINDGNNQTLTTIMPVPSGKTAYLTKWFCTLSGKVGGIIDVHLSFRPFGGVFQVKESIAIIGAGSSSYIYGYETPLSFPEKGDFKITADADTINMKCSAGFDLTFVDN